MEFWEERQNVKRSKGTSKVKTIIKPITDTKGAKARGAKQIRYLCSPSRKRWQLDFDFQSLESKLTR